MFCEKFPVKSALTDPVRSPDREKYPDRDISPDRGTLSIIETGPQNTNYLKIEHFSQLVAAKLVFPQLPTSGQP